MKVAAAGGAGRGIEVGFLRRLLAVTSPGASQSMSVAQSCEDGALYAFGGAGGGAGIVAHTEAEESFFFPGYGYPMSTNSTSSSDMDAEWTENLRFPEPENVASPVRTSVVQGKGERASFTFAVFFLLLSFWESIAATSDILLCVMLLLF